jgi:hypothetical protein
MFPRTAIASSVGSRNWFPRAIVPVHIGEVRALAVGDPDRRMLVEIVHP